MPRRELSSTIEFGSVEGGHAIDDDESESGVRHHGCGRLQELRLMICIVRSRISDIVQHVIGIQAVPAQPNMKQKPYRGFRCHNTGIILELSRAEGSTSVNNKLMNAKCAGTAFIVFKRTKAFEKQKMQPQSLRLSVGN